MRTLKWLCLALLASLLPAAVWAQCSATAGNIAFSRVNGTPTAQWDRTSTINVTCGPNLPFPNTIRVCISIPAGSGTGSTIDNRKMNSQNNLVQFQLYKDAARTQIWGIPNDANTPLALDIPITSSAAVNGTATIYARLFSGQTPASANYTSNFTAGNSGALRYAIYGSGAPVPDCDVMSTTPTLFTFSSTVTIGSSCTITAPDMNFGTKTTLAAGAAATASILVNCTSGGYYLIALNGGSTGSIMDRRMNGAGGAQIGYQLYHDLAHTLVWGDSINGLSYWDTGTGSPQIITVHGWIPPTAGPQTVGQYTDTITATLTY